jgi:hypothetical protein
MQSIGFFDLNHTMANFVLLREVKGEGKYSLEEKALI